jgi:DNA-binding helix-turn-helix protein
MPGTLTRAVVSEIKGLLKFSQEELSTISGIPRPTLTKILAGTSIIDLEQLAKIASALNTSVGALIQKAESRLARAEETSTTSPAPTLQAVPSSPVEDEEELPDFSQMAARTVSDEQYRRIMARKRFFDDLGEGVDYDPDGWTD